MNRFASMGVEDRRTVIEEASSRLGINPVVLEKDFWVCWTLGLLFGHTAWKDTLVFKGGTALSKVFKIIRRFSEDIDLSVAPAVLGISEADIESATSRRQREAWMTRLEMECGRWVQECVLSELERLIEAVLGRRQADGQWLEYQIDPNTHSPVLLFHYPSALVHGVAYILRWVKLEFGSLTDQHPRGMHRIQPWIAEIFPAPMSAMGTDVVALEAERAFWEKATILHAEFHRDPARPMPVRYSRHYADVAAMAAGDEAENALADGALLERVVNWKALFFARSWARYELASPGTFRLVPPVERIAELERDYREMQEMFLDAPTSFAEILETLRALERSINKM